MQTVDEMPTSTFEGVTETKARTLKPALRSIPRTCLERPTRKGVFLVTKAVGLWVVSLAVLFATDNPLLVLAGWIFASLALAGMFVVGHDAAHGSLFDSKKVNTWVGRLLFLPELHSYEAWLLGHNRLHHGHTVRDQMDFVWLPSTHDEYQAMSAWKKFQHRIEWGPFGSGFYYTRNVWFNKMVSFTPPERYRDKIKNDMRVVMFFGALSLAAFFILGVSSYGSFIGGLWLIIKVIGVPWFGFMTIIGWTVYVQHISPSIKWWPRNQWDSFKGQIEGTTVLRCQPIINWLFFHNIFVHVPHHVDMRIPCYNLDVAADALMEAFPEIKHDKLRLRDYISTTRTCKLYDFNDHMWMNYKGKITALVE